MSDVMHPYPKRFGILWLEAGLALRAANMGLPANPWVWTKAQEEAFERKQRAHEAELELKRIK